MVGGFVACGMRVGRLMRIPGCVGSGEADLYLKAAVVSRFRCDLGVVCGGDCLDNRQPQPVAGMAVGARGLEALERLE